MILKTSKKEVNIRLTTRKIVELTDKLKGKNLSEAYFQMYRDKDVKKLAIALETFGENEEGKKAFIGTFPVYDFLDDYMKENNLSYEDVFNQLTEEINNEGFFQKKYSQEELEELKNSYLSGLNMNEIVQQAVQEITKESLKTDVI